MQRATLGDDELEVLAFLAQQRLATSLHVQVLLDCGPQTAGRRLRGLVAAGLAARQEIFAHQPASCWITRRGLRAIGSSLPAPKPDLERYRHDLGVAWLWLAARNGAFGRLQSQVSERTMRSSDRRGRSPNQDALGPTAGSAITPPRAYGVGIVGAGARGGLQLHYPDLLLQTASGHRVAVELELSGKGQRRLERIMLGYAADARIDAALYLCPPGQLGRHVQAAARRAGIGERVHVQRLAPGSPAGAPPPDAAVSVATAATASATRTRAATLAPPSAATSATSRGRRAASTRSAAAEL